MSSLFPSPATTVTTQERQRAEGLLKDAYAQGRIDEVELDERMTLVLGSEQRTDLMRACSGVVPVQAMIPPIPRPAVTRGTGLASLAHFSALFTWIIGPWLAYQVAAPGSYARREAAKAFNFQVVASVLAVVTGVVASLLTESVGVVMVIGWLGWFLLTVFGGVRAAGGSDWRNPVTRVINWQVLDPQR
ncbi:DUF1707 and DUF4870 domain-containing protein [Nigerium massiliense]|uniref:DUF1707 and DUF4870 domain-containing protein n=1 Tax=Nigerium massiliense TaxID=1522317 RepID=UPI00058C01C2|nr:DUF1707 and DUF4870 domain-containing protein [Nigerium massiliense]